MELLVIGAGEMGRWFADTLAARGVAARVAFADADPAVAEAAATALDAPAEAVAVALDADRHFDAVCVAVPLPAAGAVVEEHAAKANEAIVDVTGAMEPPLSAMARVAPDRERLSLHPLFSAANAPGNVAVSRGAPGPTTERIERALDEAGNDLVVVGPEEHDDAMRTVQGRAHAAVLAFALAAADAEIPEGLSTPIHEALADLVAQVTGGTPRVYADIQSAFGGADDVAAAAARVADADREAFEELYATAGAAATRTGGEDDHDVEPDG